MNPYDDAVDGPPPTPYEKARRRRRRRWIIASGVGVLVLGAAVFAFPRTFWFQPADEGVAGQEGFEDEAPAQEQPQEEDEEAEEAFDPPDIEVELDDDGRPDTTVPDEERLTRLDLEELEGTELTLAELLLDIDASERAMLGFQLDVRAARDADRSSEEADEVDDEIRVAALHALESLAVLRERMERPDLDPGDEQDVEQVRDTYVVHLDSWVRWLEAVVDDPDALNDETGWFTIDINRTAAAFVRAVDEAMTDDLDAEVVRFAEELLDRGFPAPEESPV